MNRTTLYFLLTIFSCFFAVGVLSAAERESLFEIAFQGDSLPDGWRITPGVTVGGEGLRVEVFPGEDTHGNASATLSLPVGKFADRRIAVYARTKAEDVRKPPHSWNGVKCMLKIDTPGHTAWEQQSSVYGSFDAKDLVFITAVPRETTAIDLILGLENTSGTAVFENVRIVSLSRRTDDEKPFDPQSVYRGHDRPRLRGAMIHPRSFWREDLDVIAGKWKANHVRWQLIGDGFPQCGLDYKPVEEYNAWLEKELAHFEEMLPHLVEQGVLAVLDVHTPPGGRDAAANFVLFQKKEYQDAFVENWVMTAKRFRGKKGIWGYDLVNEPVEGDIAEGLMNWRELALKTAKAIREVDPDVPIIVEPAPWGSPNSLDLFEPFDPAEVPNVVYSVHFYLPHAYTHQGVYNDPAGVAYPGIIGGRQWDKETMREAMRPIVEFQRDYGVAIYLGEFSAIRWAPGAEKWLADAIDLFEEYGWDWAYHAFREWEGWSVEHGPDPGDRRRTEEPNEREMLLRKWFEKNRP